MSSPFDCYYDAQGCLVCPEVPAIDGVPARYVTQAVIGWNAGANSIDMIDGDLHAVFELPAGDTGVVMGLRGGRTRNTLPNLIEHGFYFQSAAGLDVVQVIEAGIVKTNQRTRQASDQFEIRRKGGRVTYWINDSQLYISASASHGPKVVNCCMYTSGDAAPGGTSSGGGGDGGDGGDGGSGGNGGATAPGTGSTGPNLGELTTGVTKPISVDLTGNDNYTADAYVTWVATATACTITLSDPSVAFSDNSGWLLMSYGAPSSSNDGDANWVASKTTAPFVLNVTNITVGRTYYLSLDGNDNFTDLSIEVTT